MTDRHPEPDETPQPILVAHGTRSMHGVETIGRIAEQVGSLIGPTRTTFVDVLGPSPSEILSDTSRPAVILPAFLAAGYHVRRDIPDHIARSGHRDVTLCRNLGPDPVLATILADRLRAAGRRDGDAVVLAAAGSSDPHARAEVHHAARLLSQQIGTDVPVGYIATGEPRVADVVRSLRAAGRRRVFIASYLLAPGLFHDRLTSCGADGVGAPLGADPRIAALIASRYAEAVAGLDRRSIGTVR
ncbi:sirohydrochlorin chelatase [Gordonia sp. NPDC003424]